MARRKTSRRRRTSARRRRVTSNRGHARIHYLLYVTPRGERKLKRLGHLLATARVKLADWKRRSEGRGLRVLKIFASSQTLRQLEEKHRARMIRPVRRRPRRTTKNARRSSRRRATRRNSRRRSSRRRTSRRRAG